VFVIVSGRRSRRPKPGLRSIHELFGNISARRILERSRGHKRRGAEIRIEPATQEEFRGCFGYARVVVIVNGRRS